MPAPYGSKLIIPHTNNDLPVAQKDQAIKRAYLLTLMKNIGDVFWGKKSEVQAICIKKKKTELKSAHPCLSPTTVIITITHNLCFYKKHSHRKHQYSHGRGLPL